MSIGKLLETTGIDLVPYAIGVSKFNSNAPFEPTKLKDIRDKVQSLDANRLDDALKYSKELLDEESSRGEKIEGKAYNLIGVTSISAAFVTGITSLLPKESQFIFSFLLIPLLIVYLFIVISLTLTVLLASRVVIVGDYRFSYPNIADVFRMDSQDLIETKIDRLTSYLYCYSKNSQAHNIKASYLIGGQLWFRNSVILFLILAFLLMPIFFSIATGSNQISTPETSTMTVTSTLVPPSLTVQATATIKQLETSTLSLTATPAP